MAGVIETESPLEKLIKEIIDSTVRQIITSGTPLTEPLELAISNPVCIKPELLDKSDKSDGSDESGESDADILLDPSKCTKKCTTDSAIKCRICNNDSECECSNCNDEEESKICLHLCYNNEDTIPCDYCKTKIKTLATVTIRPCRVHSKEQVNQQAYQVSVTPVGDTKLAPFSTTIVPRFLPMPMHGL